MIEINNDNNEIYSRRCNHHNSKESNERTCKNEDDKLDGDKVTAASSAIFKDKIHTA